MSTAMLEALEQIARDAGIEASCASKRGDNFNVKAWSELQNRIDPIIRTMKGLHDPEGRRRLAEVVVWGTPARRMTRDQIAKRLEIVLERMSKKLAKAVKQ